jgi:hypothetical protein
VQLEEIVGGDPREIAGGSSVQLELELEHRPTVLQVH